MKQSIHYSVKQFQEHCIIYHGIIVNAGFERLNNHIGPQATVADQTAAAQQLIKRLLPSRYGSFHAEVDPDMGPENLDTFEVVKHKYLFHSFKMWYSVSEMTLNYKN